MSSGVFLESSLKFYGIFDAIPVWLPETHVPEDVPCPEPLEVNLFPLSNEVFSRCHFECNSFAKPFLVIFCQNRPDQNVVNFRPPQVPMEVSPRAKNLGIVVLERAESTPHGPEAWRALQVRVDLSKCLLQAKKKK